MDGKWSILVGVHGLNLNCNYLILDVNLIVSQDQYWNGKDTKIVLELFKA